jgi:hypothetical protein
MTYIGMWTITVAGYGSFGYVGSEDEAEAMRKHKANWERGVGKKVRVRDADKRERARHGNEGPFCCDKPAAEGRG